LSGPVARPRLTPDQLAELARIVETGPDREIDGVVRWRRVDLKRVVFARFGVDYHERYVGRLLKRLDFSHISARPRHLAQDEPIVEAFKKNFPRVLSIHLDGLAATTPVEIWFQSLNSGLTRGTKPALARKTAAYDTRTTMGQAWNATSSTADQRYESAYL
jgi:hypothetical protein